MLLFFHFPHKNGYEIPEKPSKRKNITNVHCYQCERSSGLKKNQSWIWNTKFFHFCLSFFVLNLSNLSSSASSCGKKSPKEPQPCILLSSIQIVHNLKSIWKFSPNFRVTTSFQESSQQSVNHIMKTNTQKQIKIMYEYVWSYQLVSMHSRYSALDVIGDSSRVRPMAPAHGHQARHTHRHHRHRPPVGTCEVVQGDSVTPWRVW